MNKTRLEAFSDGVIAIIITIMVLELKIPHGTDLADLGSVLPVLLRYLLSFIYVGIYWVNHHHLFESVERIDSTILWANLHLLFWLSLVPFITAWAGEHPMESVPVALYGAGLLMCSLAFMLLNKALREQDAGAPVSQHRRWQSRKNLLSVMLYSLAILLSFAYAPAASLLHVIVAGLWFSPGSRVSRAG